MPNKRWQILQNAYPLTRRAVRRIHSSATKEERAWTATTPSRTEPSSFPPTSIRRHSQFDLQKRQEQTESLSGIMVPRSRAGAVQLPGRKKAVTPCKRIQVLRHSYPLTKLATKLLQPFATTTNASSNGNNTIVRGTIITLIHIQTAATTRSTTKEGWKTLRHPIPGAYILTRRCFADNGPNQRGHVKRATTDSVLPIPPHKARGEKAPSIRDHKKCQLERQ